MRILSVYRRCSCCVGELSASISLSLHLSSSLPSLFLSHHGTVGQVSVLTDGPDFQPCVFSVQLLDAVIGYWGSQATQGSQGNNYSFLHSFLLICLLPSSVSQQLQFCWRPSLVLKALLINTQTHKYTNTAHTHEVWKVHMYYPYTWTLIN